MGNIKNPESPEYQQNPEYQRAYEAKDVEPSELYRRILSGNMQFTQVEMDAIRRAFDLLQKEKDAK